MSEKDQPEESSDLPSDKDLPADAPSSGTPAEDAPADASTDDTPVDAVPATQEPAEQRADEPVTPTEDPDPAPADELRDRGARRLGGTALWLALLALIGCIGLAGAGYLLQQRQASAQADRGQELVQLSEANRALRMRATSLDESRDALATELDSQNRRLQSLQREVEQLVQKQLDAENTLTRISRAVEGGTSTWKIAEVEQLLLTANARIQLERDVAGALTALKLADQRMALLADPSLFEVRKAIASEITALRAVPSPDTQSLVLKLGSLAEGTRRLTLKGGETPVFKPRRDTREAPTELKPLERFLDAIKRMFNALVVLHRDEAQHEPLMPPEQKFFLYQNLQLQFESARLAVLERDETSLRSILRSAESWLHQYFDTAKPAVAAALDSITEIGNARLDPPLPDVSGSLTALRRAREAE